VVLLGFTALSVDVGNLYAAKAELQNAADAAALAGASAFAQDSLRKGSFGTDKHLREEALRGYARERSLAWAAHNECIRKHVVLEPKDIVVGRFDYDKASAPLDLASSPNAVLTTPRFTKDSPNGPVFNFFASILGFRTTDVSATAVAAFDDRFAAYAQPSGGPLIPVSIHVDLYDDLLVNGPDDFTYDEDLDLVKSFPDGISEVRLFPYSASDPPAGSGNFGLMNVGTENQGVPAVAAQIENGIAPADLEIETGARELTFFDDGGNPVNYEVTGSPGIDASLVTSLESRLGDVVGFFVHSDVVDSGSNATYTIVRIAFGRVVDVNLTGAHEDRQLLIQPVVYSDPGVKIHPAAEGSHGMVGQVVLVR
jgi:hypothetical protein